MGNITNSAPKKNMQIQAVRGICMICVCFIHVCGYAENYSDEVFVILRTIVNFCTGTFFFISAYLTNFDKVKRDSKKWVLSRVTKLYTPFIFYSVFYTLIGKQFDFSSIGGIVKTIIKVFLGSNIAHLYFIIILIIFTVFTPVLVKIIEGKNKFLLFILFIFSFVYLSISFLNYIGISVFMIENYLPLQIIRVLPFAYTICFVLGLYLKMYGFSKRNLLFCLPVVLISAIACNIYELKQINLPLNYVSGQKKLINILYITAIMLSFDKILNILKKVNTKLLEKVAEYSFGIYFLHMFIIQVIFKLFSLTNLTYSDNILLYLLFIFVSTALTVLLSFLCFFIADKLIKNKFLRKLLCIG